MSDNNYEMVIDDDRVEIGSIDTDLSEIIGNDQTELEIARSAVAQYVHDKDLIRIGYLIQRLCQGEPVYRGVFDLVNRVKTKEIPTMGVNIRSGNAYLYFNPDFLSTLTTDEATDVLRHEALHLVFEHVSERSFKECGLPHRMVNIAMDLVINSYLDHLPKGCWKPKYPMYQRQNDNTWVANKEISDFLMTLEEKMDTEYYLAMLRKAAEENPSIDNQINPPSRTVYVPVGAGGGQGDGQGEEGEGSDEGNESGKGGGEGEEEEGEGDGNGGGGKLPQGMDEQHADNSGVHGGWNTDGETEEQKGDREAFGNRVKDAMERAVARANSSAQGWGSTPAHLRKFIEELLIRSIPWQAVLKRFLAATKRADSHSTIMRPNRRYGTLYPGNRLNYKPTINVYIDQSGSVGDEMLARFFGELGGLAKETEFRCYYFDTEVDEDSMQVWKRGANPIINRTRCGGTDFEAPTQHALANKCDGFIILTDGEAPKPSNTVASKRRCWIIGEGHKLYFEPHPADIVINLDEMKWDKMRKAGAKV
jgi:predicted metal-dependent peptidase